MRVNLLKYLLLLSTGLLFTVLVYAYYNFQFWTHVKTTGFKSLTEYHGSKITGFRGRQILVNRDFLPQMKIIEDYAKKYDVKVVVTQSYRYKGPEPGDCVAEPVKHSNHLAGYAIDFNLKYKHKTYTSQDLRRENLANLPENIRDFIQAIREEPALRWGGDFKKENPVHIDYPLNINKPELWAADSASCHQDYSTAIPVWMFWK